MLRTGYCSAKIVTKSSGTKFFTGRLLMINTLNPHALLRVSHVVVGETLELTATGGGKTQEEFVVANGRELGQSLMA